jgi:hypothetical protein
MDIIITNEYEARLAIYKLAKTNHWYVVNCMDCISEALETEDGWEIALTLSSSLGNEGYTSHYIVSPNGEINHQETSELIEISESKVSWTLGQYRHQQQLSEMLKAI